jgi:hypothetical protein
MARVCVRPRPGRELEDQVIAGGYELFGRYLTCLSERGGMCNRCVAVAEGVDGGIEDVPAERLLSALDLVQAHGPDRLSRIRRAASGSAYMLTVLLFWPSSRSLFLNLTSSAVRYAINMMLSGRLRNQSIQEELTTACRQQCSHKCGLAASCH